jgi:tetratricopeptide (TPR) repeat protein
LTFEAERLGKQHDESTRNEAKMRAVVRINLSLSSGDYSSALVLLRGAAAEFPEDAQLSALQTLAQDGIKRKAAADLLITESQERFARQEFAEAIQLLREAYELDKANSLARSILANALVEHASSIVETDWWGAETLANEALVLNAAHPTAKTIHSRILEQKMTGSIEEWVSQTRTLQSTGNLTAALSQIAEGLDVYPHETRLLQIQDQVQRDYGAQRRQARRRDLDELRRKASEVDAVADHAQKKEIAERIRSLTTKYSTDGEILSVANDLLRRLGSVEIPRKSLIAPAEVEGATGRPRAPVQKTLAASVTVARPAPAGRVLSEEVASIPVVAEPVAAEPVVPAPVPSVIFPASVVAAEIVQPDEVPSPQAGAQSPSLQIASAPDTESSAPMAGVTSSASGPEEPATSNSIRAMVAAAAAIVVVATISYFAGTRHGSEANKNSAAPSSVPSSGVSVSVPAVTTPVVSAPAQTAPEPSLPASSSSSDTAAAPATKLQPQNQQAQNVQPKNVQAQSVQAREAQSQGVQAQNPQPRLASLTVQGGSAGAVVLVDQTPAGTVQSDGTFSIASITPGDHTVELRKERFQPRQFKKRFGEGETILLRGADAALEAASGELKITFAPTDAKVALVKGDLLTMVSSGVALNLVPGTYTLTARTSDRFTRSSTVEVIAGQSKSLNLLLTPDSMSKWDDPGAWKKEGDSSIRKGGEFVLYGVIPTSGTFVFSAMATKGHLLQWVLNYTDSKNYILFQMDDNNFYRTVIRNGKKSDEIIVPDKGDKKSFRTLIIRVSPTEILHQIKHGSDGTVVLDRWAQAGADTSLGKFGFYLPGNDEVTLSSFTHYADLNLR